MGSCSPSQQRPQGKRDDKETANPSLAGETFPEKPKDENVNTNTSVGEFVTFDGGRDFVLGEMKQLVIEGNAVYGKSTDFVTGWPQQIPKSEARPRKTTIFKNTNHLKIATAEFINVNGNAYGLSAFKFDGRRLEQAESLVPHDGEGLPASKMTVFAFTAGSLGDILTTAGLAGQIAKVLYDNRHIQEECAALTVELQSLQQVLLLTSRALQQYEATPLGFPLAHFIRPEVTLCSEVLARYANEISVCRASLAYGAKLSALWRRIIWVATGEAASLSSELRTHRLKLALMLISLNTIGLLDPIKDRLASLPEAQLQRNNEVLPFKNRAKDTVNIVDHLGDQIQIPMMFCSSWESFHFFITHHCQNRVGQAYIDQEDYEVIRRSGNRLLGREDFGRVVQQGDTLEISIILRSRSRDIGEKVWACPRCPHIDEQKPSEGDWTKCHRCFLWFSVDLTHPFVPTLEHHEDPTVKNDHKEDDFAKIGCSLFTDDPDVKFLRRITHRIQQAEKPRMKCQETETLTCKSIDHQNGANTSTHRGLLDDEPGSDELIVFDGSKNFDLGKLRKVTIDGDAHFGDESIDSFKPFLQNQTPRHSSPATTRRMTVFKNSQGFYVASAEFISVHGDAYGLSMGIV